MKKKIRIKIKNQNKDYKTQDKKSQENHKLIYISEKIMLDNSSCSYKYEKNETKKTQDEKILGKKTQDDKLRKNWNILLFT